jgi:hypothetical protein
VSRADCRPSALRVGARRGHSTPAIRNDIAEQRPGNRTVVARRRHSSPPACCALVKGRRGATASRNPASGQEVWQDERWHEAGDRHHEEWSDADARELASAGVEPRGRAVIDIRPYSEEEWIADTEGKALSTEEFVEHLRRARS